MIRSPRRLALAAGGLLYGLAAGGIPPVAAVEPTFAPQALLDQTAQAAAAPPIYVPPRRGGPSDVAPAATRGGAVRHKVKLLAPDHTGLTTSAKPTLYMYVGETSRLQLLLTRIGDTAAPPVASGRVDARDAPAILAVRLDSIGANLETGVEYRLTVMALDQGGSIRASDAVQIMRVAAPPELAAAAAAGTPQAQARVYAGAGVWYDALHALGQAVAAKPGDPSPRTDRAALLEQAGMPEIAFFDRRAAPRG